MIFGKSELHIQQEVVWCKWRHIRSRTVLMTLPHSYISRVTRVILNVEY